jgi:hypothetical protein
MSHYDDLARAWDVFFNGRPAQPISKVNIEEIVRRGVSYVRVGDKLYRIECKEMVQTK